MSAAVSVLDAAILSTRQGKNTNKIRDNDVLRRIFSIEGDHRGGALPTFVLTAMVLIHHE